MNEYFENDDETGTDTAAFDAPVEDTTPPVYEIAPSHRAGDAPTFRLRMPLDQFGVLYSNVEIEFGPILLSGDAEVDQAILQDQTYRALSRWEFVAQIAAEYQKAKNVRAVPAASTGHASQSYGGQQAAPYGGPQAAGLDAGSVQGLAGGQLSAPAGPTQQVQGKYGELNVVPMNRLSSQDFRAMAVAEFVTEFKNKFDVSLPAEWLTAFDNRDKVFSGEAGHSGRIAFASKGAPAHVLGLVKQSLTWVDFHPDGTIKLMFTKDLKEAAVKIAMAAMQASAPQAAPQAQAPANNAGGYQRPF